MPPGWNVFVYRTDVDPEEYKGFFYSTETAEAWVTKQEEGLYEVSDRKPVQKSRDAKFEQVSESEGEADAAADAGQEH